MKKKLVLAVAVLTVALMFMLTPKVEASSRNIEASEDSWIASSAPGSNYGSSVQMQVDYPSFPINSIDKAYIKFSLTDIPSESTISDAKVFLYTPGEAAGEANINVHFCDSDGWSESSITWNNAPDYDDEVLDNVTLPVTSAYLWFNWTVTSKVQTEYEYDKTITLVFETTTGDTATTFCSTEGTQEPYLAVTYTYEGSGGDQESYPITLYYFPYQISIALGLSSAGNYFAGRLLVSAFSALIVMIPVAVYSKGWTTSLMVGSGVLGVCIAIGWLPMWFLLIILTVVIAWLKPRITGGGET